MSTKILEDAHLKAATIADVRTITYYILAFGDPNGMPDKQGDIIEKSAADGWLEGFYAAGVPLPVSWTHQAIVDPGDPFHVIGHIPADREHMRKDDHGILATAVIDTETNPEAAQVYSLVKRRVIRGASVAYFTTPEGQRVRSDGATIVTKIDDIIESGPCLEGANAGAYVVAIKASGLTTKALDDSPWDGNRAMGEASTAAQYRQICAGEHNAGTPDQRQHWALPHHYVGRDANAAGVAAARQRFAQTQDLKNRDAVRAHLFESHRLPSDATTSSAPFDDLQVGAEFIAAAATSMTLKSGRVLSAASKAKLLAIIETANELLASSENAAHEEQETNGEDPSGNPEESPLEALRQELDAITA